MLIEAMNFMWDVMMIMGLMIGIIVCAIIICPPAIYVVIRATVSYLRIIFQERFSLSH